MGAATRTACIPSAYPRGLSLVVAGGPREGAQSSNHFLPRAGCLSRFAWEASDPTGQASAAYSGSYSRSDSWLDRSCGRTDLPATAHCQDGDDHPLRSNTGRHVCQLHAGNGRPAAKRMGECDRLPHVLARCTSVGRRPESLPAAGPLRDQRTRPEFLLSRFYSRHTDAICTAALRRRIHALRCRARVRCRRIALDGRCARLALLRSRFRVSCRIHSNKPRHDHAAPASRCRGDVAVAQPRRARRCNRRADRGGEVDSVAAIDLALVHKATNIDRCRRRHRSSGVSVVVGLDRIRWPPDVPRPAAARRSGRRPQRLRPLLAAWRGFGYLSRCRRGCSFDGWVGRAPARRCNQSRRIRTGGAGGNAPDVAALPRATCGNRGRLQTAAKRSLASAVAPLDHAAPASRRFCVANRTRVPCSRTDGRLDSCASERVGLR